MSEPDPEPDPATQKLIANERAKLTATYVNGVAIAVLAVGGLALCAERHEVGPRAR